MRDLETISTAITAAETGHLVFATLHTQDAPQTIDRIIDVFPPHQQQQVRVQLATTLQGVVTQQLIPTADGQGRAAARARSWSPRPAVRNLIREGKVHQIYSSMQAGGRFGMQTMDMSLAQLVKAGRITQQMAFERCHDPEELQRLIGGGFAGVDAGGHGRQRHRAADVDGRHDAWAGCRRRRWPQTYQYKVRDQAGNLVTGIAGGRQRDCSSCSACASMGYTPARGGQGEEGPQHRDQPQAEEGQAQGARGLLAAVRHDGQLGPADPAGARRSWPTRPTNKELAETLTACRIDVEQGASLSGAMQKHPKVFNDLYISMVKSGETGGSLDDVLLRLAAMLEREVQLRGKIKSAMTYPVAVVALVVLIMAAMLLFVVPQFETIYGQLGGKLPLPTRVLLDDVEMRSEVLVHGRPAARSGPGSRSAVQEDRRADARSIDAAEAPGPGVRAAVPQDGALAVLQHARRCC